MGEQKVSLVQDNAQMQRFMKQLLNDMQAIEYMIDHDWFESDITRIGAEQEMVLVQDQDMKPATVAMEALDLMKDLPWVETELAKFNLETTLPPLEFTGNCFHVLENKLLEQLAIIKKRIEPLKASPLLVGILPTLRKFDVEETNLTPLDRYKALMQAIKSQMPEESVELRLLGVDELLIKHNTPLLEACNTSFQVHLQVAPQNFVHQYNIAQAITGPLMAAAANSSLVFGKRLWHENRIALFQQALDTRATTEHLRESAPRVQFGRDWLHHSILDIYREDISRFRAILSANVEVNSMDQIMNEQVPKLKALQVHNGTIYRWNRPCYGISDNGKPHLRIENRVFGAGPTIRDEVTNAAVWLGLMIGMSNYYDDIRKYINFEDVSDNFSKAAQFGLDTSFTWTQDQKYSARDLLLGEFLPLAKAGLEQRGVDSADIDTYIGTMTERVKAHATGARWMLRSYSALIKQTTRDEALTVMTSFYAEQSQQEKPIHTWDLPELNTLRTYNPSKLTVGEFMKSDLFTVRPEDIIELVAEMMEWRNIKYTPVENEKGKLIGLVSSSQLLEYYTKYGKIGDDDIATVEDIMLKDVVTTEPSTNIITAMDIMQKHNIGCLPIVYQGELVGLVDAMDLLNITGRVMRRLS